ncbi:LOW QUALITY PROTEIN: hypothetical protein PHMEG_00015293 [Phytophthora megakarya]|uniref:Uncharacterized protein n=1 Tax=Phytophthora megakarya TaxID=4795 RepID=A0A225W2P8_9STRA|nr:LOW QUALITY PROTEIN: hypothetical protein PHMEG_00015293 [Phytophthora megakarya]
MLTYPIKNRSKVYECYETFRKTYVNNIIRDVNVLQYMCPKENCQTVEEGDVQILQAGHVQEYEHLGDHIFQKYGTHAQSPTAYTPQHNGSNDATEPLWNANYRRVRMRIHITKQYRDKLDAFSRLCMYLDLPEHQTAIAS